MAPHLLQVPSDLGHPCLDPPAVGFELRLAGTPRPDPAPEPLEVRPRTGQARQMVIELRQLHLQFPLPRLRPLGKDVQDQAGPVHHAAPQKLFQVPLLRAGQLLVQDDHVHPAAAPPDLFRLPLPDEVSRIQAVALLQHPLGHPRPCGARKLLQLRQRILGFPPRLPLANYADQKGRLSAAPSHDLMSDG